MRLRPIYSILAIIFASRLGQPAQQAAPVAQDPARMEQILKEAAELQSARPQAVAERLAPLLTELRPRRSDGTLGLEGARILQDALLLLLRTQSMLLLPEAQIADTFRELLNTNPRIGEDLFNPREKLLLEKLRSAETGHFELQTTPPDAALMYLGTELGKTPSDLPLIAGTYRFQLRLEGYFDQDVEVTVRPAEMMTAIRTLRRRTVEIPIAVNAPATTILLNGEVQGVSQAYAPWLASLPADRQPAYASIVQTWDTDRATYGFFRLQEVPVGETMKIEFKAACYEPLELQVNVNGREVDWTQAIVSLPALRRVELKRDTGFVEISSSPSGAEVWLDGALQGQTPLGKDVCVGPHRIQVLHRAGQYVQEVNVRSGQASKVSGEIRPALAFLGIYRVDPQKSQPAPLDADWTTVARRIALRSSAFVDPRISPEDIGALLKKGRLPVEQLLRDDPNPGEIDLLLKRISGEVGRADLLLLGLRAGDRILFRLYNLLHPVPDLIELPDLDEASLDFLVAGLNAAEKTAGLLRRTDLGVILMDSPRGLVVQSVDGAAGGGTALAPGAVVKSVNQKRMRAGELQAFLRSRTPGQSIALEVQSGKEGAAAIQLEIRSAGAEYPWNTPAGFPNAVLTMLRHLVERDPLSDGAKYAGLSLARGFMRRGEWKTALEYLAKTNLEPYKSGVCPGTVLYYQARCYEELGDPAQAANYYARAKDYTDATLGLPDGPSVPALAEQRLQSLKKPVK